MACRETNLLWLAGYNPRDSMLTPWMFSLNYPTKPDYIIYKYSAESQNILSKQTSPLIILDKLNVGM